MNKPYLSKYLTVEDYNKAIQEYYKKKQQTGISQQKPPKDHKQLKKANTRAVYKFFNSCKRPKL